MIEKISDLVIKGIKSANYREAVKHHGKRHYSPTDSGKCPRALWYTWKGFPKVAYSPKELTIFAIGTITHEYIQSVVKNQVKDEFRIDTTWNGLPVAGYVDSIIFDGEKLVVVDYKTTGSFGFSYVELKPKEDHVKQVNLYLDLLGMDDGCVLYWNKENGEMKEHHFKRDPIIVNEIKDLFLLVQRHLDDNTLPEAKYEPSKGWKCKYCKFADYCKNNSNSFEQKTITV